MNNITSTTPYISTGGSKRKREDEKVETSLTSQLSSKVFNKKESSSSEREFTANKKCKSETLGVSDILFAKSSISDLWQKAYFAESEEDWETVQKALETLDPLVDDINYSPDGENTGKTLLWLTMRSGRYAAVHGILKAFPHADVNLGTNVDNDMYSVLSLLVMNLRNHRLRKEIDKIKECRELFHYIIENCPTANWQAPIKTTRKQLTCLSAMANSRFFVFEVLHIMKNFPKQMDRSSEGMWYSCSKQLMIHHLPKFFKLYNELLTIASVTGSEGLQRYVRKFTAKMTKEMLLSFLQQYSDVTLTFEDDTKLCMSKAFLSFFVPHFYRMFHSPFAEASGVDVQFLEYNPELFIDVICGQALGFNSIRKENVCRIIALADYLELEKIKQLCEEWICQNILILDGKNLSELVQKELVELAEQYQLKKVQQKHLEFLLREGWLNEGSELEITSKLVSGLTHLKLATDDLPSLEHLFTHASKLEHLHLCHITPKIAKILHHLKNLRTLEVDNYEKLPGDMLALFPKTLKKINLAMFDLNDHFVKDLPSALEELSLRGIKIDDKMIAELPRGIKVLDLGENGSDEAMIDLPPLLEELRMCDNLATGECLKFLPRSIKMLNISSMENITLENLKDLPPELHCLNILASDITDEGLGLLPKSITRLTLLGYDGTMNSLSSLPPGLTHLRMSNYAMNDSGLLALPKSLERLQLRWVQGFTAEGVNQMIPQYPSLTFLYIKLDRNSDISLRSGWEKELQHTLEIKYNRYLKIAIDL